MKLECKGIEIGKNEVLDQNDLMGISVEMSKKEANIKKEVEASI